MAENTPKKTPPSTAWKPGCPSPNPGGRPKGSGTAEVVELARRVTTKVLRRLEGLVDAPGTEPALLVRIATIAADVARIPREESTGPQTIRFEFVSGDAWTAPVGGDDTSVVTVPEGHA